MEIQAFAARLADCSLSEVDKAVAIIWFLDHFNPGHSCTLQQLGRDLHETGLTSQVNLARLRQRLGKDRRVVRGDSSDSFKLRLQAKSSLDNDYLEYLETRNVKVDEAIVPSQMVAGTRGYLIEMVRQINGTYQYGFYDSCAVMCRRTIESLIVEAMDNAGHIAAIQDNGNIMMLNGIIGVVSSGRYIRLGRNTPAIIEKIKTVGDRAAHDRYHIATQNDLKDIAIDFRAVLSELLELADIGKQGTTTSSESVLS